MGLKQSLYSKAFAMAVMASPAVDECSETEIAYIPWGNSDIEVKTLVCSRERSTSEYEVKGLCSESIQDIGFAVQISMSSLSRGFSRCVEKTPTTNPFSMFWKLTALSPAFDVRYKSSFIWAIL